MAYDWREIGGVPITDIDLQSGAKGLYTAIVTSDDAEILLLLNDENRQQKKNVVEKYAQAMRHGEFDWCEGDASKLMFGKGGVLRNGGHRLLAQVKANVTGVYDVRTGVPAASYDNMDTISVRYISDALGKVENSKDVSAVALCICHAARGFSELRSGSGNRGLGSGTEAPTRNEILYFARENYAVLNNVVKMARVIRKTISKGSVAGIGAALYMLRCHGFDTVGFVNDFETGNNGCSMTVQAILKKIVMKNFNPRSSWWCGVTLVAAHKWRRRDYIRVIRNNVVDGALRDEIVWFKQYSKSIS